MSQPSVSHRAKAGVVLNGLSKGLSTLLLIVGSVVLTRLLDARDFGLVQMCLVVVEFATRLGDFGFGMSIVQQDKAVRKEQVNALFLADFGFRVLMFVTVLLTTPLSVRYFNEPKLADVLPAVAVYLLVDVLAVPGLALLERDLNFRASAIVELASRTLEVVSSIVLALLGAGLYSLIAGRVLGSLLAALLAAAYSGWRPSLAADFRGSRQLFRFGGWILVRSFFKYLADNIDYFLVGRYLGTEQLGYYSRAFTIMRLPLMRITRTLNSVLFSAFARVQQDPERIQRGLRKAIVAISLITFPLMIGMALLAEEFVELAFGEKWKPMTLALQIMCLSGAVRATEPLLVSVVTATGHVKLAALRRFMEFVLLAIGCALGVRYGIEGVALAIAIVSVVMVLVLADLTKYAGIRSWRTFFGGQVPALLAGSVMAAAIYVARIAWNGFGWSSTLISFVIMGTVGALAYVGALILSRHPEVVTLWREGRGELERLRGKLRARHGRGA